MTAGGPGDHPLSDILNYNIEVFGKECDDLIKEISRYTSREEMLEIFDWFNKNYFKNHSKLKLDLKLVLEKLKQDRKGMGWEIQ
ncbi:MAG: hypothetical protein CVU07_03005 [Bacteroidetes bacterium HGW-Bacteroidetes-23]|nr:MAG: hypothetical protein CVU07_03005 [Bacteroidetes bacterium HGW-Bacteroidetes-23]